MAYAREAVCGTTSASGKTAQGLTNSCRKTEESWEVPSPTGQSQEVRVALPKVDNRWAAVRPKQDVKRPRRAVHHDKPNSYTPQHESKLPRKKDADDAAVSSVSTTAPAHEEKPSEKSTIRCGNCREWGHRATECSACYNCGKRGHVAKRCPRPVRCFYCQGAGHVAQKCALNVRNDVKLPNVRNDVKLRAVRKDVKLREDRNVIKLGASSPLAGAIAPKRVKTREVRNDIKLQKLVAETKAELAWLTRKLTELEAEVKAYCEQEPAHVPKPSKRSKKGKKGPSPRGCHKEPMTTSKEEPRFSLPQEYPVSLPQGVPAQGVKPSYGYDFGPAHGYEETEQVDVEMDSLDDAPMDIGVALTDEQALEMYEQLMESMR